MKKCKCCNLYIDEESSFCPYCGKKSWKAVQQVELEASTQTLTVKTEVYKYKGEERNRYVFYTDRQEKISSFVPDFSANIEKAWLIGDDRIFLVTNQQEILKVRVLGINKKSSTEICKLPSGNHGRYKEFYAAKDGRFLLSEERYLYGQSQTVFYLINGNDILTYSVNAEAFEVELYSDDFIMCNQGRKEIYLLTSDGMVQTVSSMYDQEELLRRYHTQCIEADQYEHPEIIWATPHIKGQTFDRNSGEIYVSLSCEAYEEDHSEYASLYRPCSCRHEDTLLVNPEEELPIKKMPPTIMDASEWKEEADDIRYMQQLVAKDNPEWEWQYRLYGFYRFWEDFIYGTTEQEQFIYDKKHRTVCFFPLGKHGTADQVLKYATEYKNEHPEKFLVLQNLKQMHLLDSVTGTLIRTHEARLQPFFEYMKNAWQYDSMVKGETGFRKIMYSISDFLDAVDMVIGVCYTDEAGDSLVGWKEQEVMYTERVTGMIVRMNTPYGKKVVHIPFGTGTLVKVRMTDDRPASNRNEWYTALKGQWTSYSRKEIPNVPIPCSTICMCSNAVNRVEMSRHHLYSDDYRLPYRCDMTCVDLGHSPDGYKLKPDESVGSFYYRTDDNMKVAVDDLTDIHLYALSQDGIFYIKDHQLYFRGSNNESKDYDGKYFNSVRLNVSEHYVFIDCVDKYIQGDSYDAYGYTEYLTDFTVKYQTKVISRATGECVAVWKDMPEITQIFQLGELGIVVATGKFWYQIAENDEGIRSLSDAWNREKKGMVFSKDLVGEKAYALTEQYGIENLVIFNYKGKTIMVVDGTYKEFS